MKSTCSIYIDGISTALCARVFDWQVFLAVAAPGFKKWGGKKGATIDYGGANMCA